MLMRIKLHESVLWTAEPPQDSFKCLSTLPRSRQLKVCHTAADASEPSLPALRTPSLPRCRVSFSRLREYGERIAFVGCKCVGCNKRQTQALAETAQHSPHHILLVSNSAHTGRRPVEDLPSLEGTTAVGYARQSDLHMLCNTGCHQREVMGSNTRKNWSSGPRHDSICEHTQVKRRSSIRSKDGVVVLALSAAYFARR